MGLFRPYERKDSADDKTEKSVSDQRKGSPEVPAAPGPKTARRQSMVIGSTATTTRPAKPTPAKASATATTKTPRSGAKAEPTNAELDALKPSTDELEALRPRGPQPKAGPTPTRRQAEAARKERLNPSLSPKESRRLAAANQRETRAKAMSNAEAAPEKQLLRDYIDRRFNLGEFLLPACLVILALTFLNSAFPGITWITTGVMYVFILTVLADSFFMWRGFRRLLAERFPNATTKGLAFYAFNRTIQIRRLRIPRPRVKRGEKI